MTGGCKGYVHLTRSRARHEYETTYDTRSCEMNLGASGMAVFVVVLAVILVGAFAGVWLHDRRRSHILGDDESRQGTDRPQRTGRRR
jgi:hypothetical protein